MPNTQPTSAPESRRAKRGAHPSRLRHSLKVRAALAGVATLMAGCTSDDSETQRSAATDDPPATGAASCTSPGISTEEWTAPAPSVVDPPAPFTADLSLRGRSITVYSGRDEELLQPLIDRFTQSTGIDVTVRYGESAEMGAQLLEEGDDTPADVFYSQEVGALGVLSKARRLASLPTELVETVDERFQPGEGRNWVGVTGRSRVIVYNPDEVDEPPRCTAALTDAEYAGKVAVVPGNAGFQAFVTAYRVAEGDAAAREWLEGMIDNDLVTSFEKNGDVLDAVNNGDVAVGLINHYYWARREDRDNLTAQLVFPGGDDPGALVNATAVGLTTRADNNPAALAFVEFLLSPEGQTAFVEQTWEYPVIDGVADPAGVPPLDELEGPPLDLTDLDSLEDTQELLADVGLDVT